MLPCKCCRIFNLIKCKNIFDLADDMSRNQKSNTQFTGYSGIGKSSRMHCIVGYNIVQKVVQLVLHAEQQHTIYIVHTETLLERQYAILNIQREQDTNEPKESAIHTQYLKNTHLFSLAHENHLSLNLNCFSCKEKIPDDEAFHNVDGCHLYFYSADLQMKFLFCLCNTMFIMSYFLA